MKRYFTRNYPLACSNRDGKCKPKAPLGCKNRAYRDCAADLRAKLGVLQNERAVRADCLNREEVKYRDYGFSGSFHKTLQHDINGTLTDTEDYNSMRRGIVNNDQDLLASVSLATGATMKLANPLASWATCLVGKTMNGLKIPCAPALSSDAAAADMVEVYTHAYVRDVPFIDYSTSGVIATVLGVGHMNAPGVVANLLYPPGAFGGGFAGFTAKNLFRGPSALEQYGPYISQFLYLNIPYGTAATPVAQLYATLPAPTYPAPALPAPRSEWGINKMETVYLQNGQRPSSLFAPVDTKIARYIFDGRSLAETVHNDAVYQFFYQAAVIMSSAPLSLPVNPGIPSYVNQGGFITAGNAAALCTVAEVADLALKHAWYWKWQKARRLRPETMGLWVQNVMDGSVGNAGNYDLSDVLLDNGILTTGYGPSGNPYMNGSYTLPLCYQEGSPTHPSYPAGHAAIAGACVTVLKMFYDCERVWPVQVVEANSIGTALVNYTGTDAGMMTVTGELDKLASNISIGRDWAGVHYRTDGVAGMELGEMVAMAYMSDLLSSWVENKSNGCPPAISFRKFDGTIATVKPTVCSTCN